MRLPPLPLPRYLAVSAGVLGLSLLGAGELLASSGWHAAQHPVVHRTAPHRVIWSQMLPVPWGRNPAADSRGWPGPSMGRRRPRAHLVNGERELAHGVEPGQVCRPVGPRRRR